MNNKIAAVVVTYNRKVLLVECIEALLNQNRKLDLIFIIDNASTDGTKKLLLEMGYLNKDIIEYIILDYNTGGSGGFYRGIEIAYQKGFDWIWIMDDDAEPDCDCLRILESKLKYKDNIGVICPLIVNKSTKEPQWYHHKLLSDDLVIEESIINKIDIKKIYDSELVKIDSNAFVGPMISRDVIKKLGLPEKDYFILCDDLEYIYRASLDFKCFLSPNSKIYHKSNSNSVGKINKDEIWKLYYSRRNYLLFLKKYQNKKLIIFKYIIRNLKNSLKSTVSLFLKYKAGKLCVMPLMGLIDGIRGKKGDVVKPFKLD